eukprot:356348-Chlamydomonas_euryale.AAC.19
MGYLDRILGRKPRDKNGDDASDGPSAAAPEPAAPAAPEIVHEATSGAGYGPPSISSSQLPTSGIPGMMPLSPETTGGGTRLYDPYEGIAQSVGMKKQLFKMPEQPEFLFEEEASVRRRGWGENVQFYTGLGYITGASLWAGRVSVHSTGSSERMQALDDELCSLMKNELRLKPADAAFR